MIYYYDVSRDIRLGFCSCHRIGDWVGGGVK